MGTRMNKMNLIRAGFAALALVTSAGAALAQSVTLTASPTVATLPDGQSVPMWGYTCSLPSGGVTCTALNGSAQTGANWQPPLIRVPTGASLTITLNNQLSFGGGDQAIPTSIVIDGQLGGGLGGTPARTPSPVHDAQGTTWPGSAGPADSTSCGNGTFADAGTFCPPAQKDRVRSFGTEVGAGASNQLTWNNLRPGTYLIHSGTQPSIQHPMGLYGVLVVGDAPANTAYGTAYDQDVALLFSEIDPDQNRAVDAAVRTAGFSASATWAGPGACKSGAAACYPPAVNYSPRYYLINGTSFDRTAPANSTYAVPATLAGGTATLSGNVLVRIVNAGQRMHAPSVVGANLTPIAEDGNKVSKLIGTQASIPVSPGKTYDAVIHPAKTSATAYTDATLPVFDRQLSLSTNNQRDGGMQAYIAIGAGAAAGSVGSSASGVALSAPTNTTFYCIAGNTLSVTQASKGLLRGVTGASGVSLPATPVFSGDVSATTLALNADGTFRYTPSAGTACGGTFAFQVNGTGAYTATIAQCDVNSQIAGCSLAAQATANDFVVVSPIASRYVSPPPGVLAHITNPGGLALTAVGAGINADGSFVALGMGTPAACPAGPLASQVPAGASCVAIPYSAKDAQGQPTSTATAYVAFQTPSNLTVKVQDGPTGLPVTDYRWIIEEDRTFWIDPRCQVNSTDPAVRPASCPPLPVESIGYNFHSASMPVIAAGCVGTVSCKAGQTLQGTPAVCDIGNGVCRTDAAQKDPVLPGQVHLDSTKRYFISILPGDAINPTISGFGGTAQDCATYAGPSGDWVLDNGQGVAGNCGHEMGGAQIAPGVGTVTVNLQQIPLPTAKISVFVFEDDNPVNGENDAGGGVDVIAPNEPGLGGFEVKLFDQAGQLGDNTGQITYDEFNQPVSNSLAGYIDPLTGLDACPITNRTDRLVGMIPTCPKYESDGVTPSPLAGQVVIANLYPGLYEIQAYPAADRIARGEQWLQTNTLDGGKPHEAFIIPSEPGYFQEFGPGGFHVAIGFANPAIINARKGAYCASGVNAGAPCTNELQVEVSNNHMSRTPDQRTYDTESYDHYSFTQCYVSIGPADGEDFAFQPCEMSVGDDGKTHAVAKFTNMPPGVFKLTVFDQWNDIMLDGLVGTVEVGVGTTVKKFPVTQWRTNLYTRTYIDTDGSGVSDDSKPGLSLVNTNIRYRDGSIAFFNNTDLNGYAGFNEVFPFMNWLVVETTQTRFKPTWTHAVYDAGGPVDCSSVATDLDGGPLCSTIAANLANTNVRVPLPADLRVPGAKYCDSADCNTTFDGKSTGMLFPAQSFSNTIGWQGLLGQNTFIEFGVKPFLKNENGGIHGQVVYSSTRPFDDPTLLLQLSWEPGIPRATVNLYQKSVDAQGNETLKLVDTTKSASFDDWAQGFRTGPDGVTPLTAGSGADAGFVPNMNCPGQSNDSPFFATLKNSKMWMDTPDPVTGAKKTLAYQSQFKCYDGWSQLNQAQPAPYDGFYKFPSVVSMDSNGKPLLSNCSICTKNPDDGTPMLPPGTYVVEVVVPQGYELVKEEDKNILMGDVYVAPAVQQFAGFGNIFIMPDQAAVNSAYSKSNPNNLNTTTNLGAQPRHEGDTGSIEAFWPCVGAVRQVPDFNAEFPGSQQAAPFAGAMRALCDRKEVKLTDESSVLAKFFLFSDTHIAGHFTGTITNDFASEFDPFSPQFGEKFGPPNLPVGLRDFNGNEVARVYSDQWGIYNGLYFSTWSPNPPNPTGYAPQMSIACMNDPGPIMVNGVSMTDPAYNPAYSNFCYEQPFMPGTTTYMDTPVIPTQAFADGYNLPDTEYADKTPAIQSVVSDAAQGPWVRAAVNAAPASATFTVSGVARCQSATCTNPSSAVFPHGTVTCKSTTSSAGPNCSDSSGNSRAATFAAYIRNNVGTLMGAGFVASGNGANVTISANVTGTAANGTQAVTSTSNLVNPTAPVVLAGGAVASPAAVKLTITAMGDKVVQNPHFSGPNATTAPYNQKTITRHYGFGNSGKVSLVAPDGTTSVDLTGVTWSDTQIVGSVPALSNTFNCKVQQKGAPTAQCGELVITRDDNGKRSFDAITVTVGGSAPWIVTPTDVTPPSGRTVKDYASNFGRLNLVLGAAHQSPIQVALDSAEPGDLILVQPGTYRENLIMWKPVRLQGVGAGSVTVNADAHPAGHMDQWRRQMVCVFGLTLEGIPNMGNSQAAFDPDSRYSCPNDMWLKGDRIPFEAITGWQAAGNGNLAQVLQEPTLLGAYEGAGLTVVGRGVREPNGTDNFWGQDPTAAGAFPDGAVYLTDGVNNLGNVRSNVDDCVAHKGVTDGTDYGTSNYRCNPSRVDGIAILNSSQGGGGLFIHGWAHSLEVANTRISSNHGTLAGAINLGNGETPPVFLNDGATCGVGVATLCPPIPGTFGQRGNFTPSIALNEAVPFGFNTNVRIHHNMLWNNASIGDALFTGTPAGAGGVTVSAGGDGYSIDHNWIAGNLSTGDGGGVQSLGVSFNGRIANNVVMFNQSTNPTLPTNGGGIVIQGANEPRTLNGTECGGATDTDCPPGLGDGTGNGLVIDGNLVYGNSAESGTGGGIALEMVNGSEVVAFPNNPNNWYGVTLTNNIIANNVAGYDGGGVSLRDTIKATLVNNTIVSNDTTSSAGVLFKTLAAANASSPPPGCNAQTDPTLPQDPSCLGRNAPHGPQPAGLVVMAHTQNLNDAIGALPVIGGGGARLNCPNGFGYTSADCSKFSRPVLTNNLFWQNRSFSVDIVKVGTGLLSQQNLVALTPALTQTVSGQCPSGARFWDIGLRTDDVQSGILSAANNALVIRNSILTGTGDIGTTQETVASATNRYGVNNGTVNAQICNGARMPPEHCTDAGIDQNSPSCHGFNAPPGASETTSTGTLFVFNGIQPTATVDEGHNWLNLTYGPLTLARPNASTPTAGEQMVAGAAAGTQFGAYSLPLASPAAGGGAQNGAPAVDFYGNPRSGRVDIGAVQLSTSGLTAYVLPGSVSFGDVVYGTSGTAQTVTLTNSTGAAINGIAVTPSSPFTRVTTGLPANACGTGATFILNAGQSCAIVINVTVPTSASTGSTAITGTLAIVNTSSVTITNAPVQLSANGVPPVNDLGISKDDGLTTLYRGQTATYTIKVSNNGNTTISGATVTDTRPAAFTSWNWSCTASTGANCGANSSNTNASISKVLGAVAPGASVTFTVTATVAGNAAAGPVVNTAKVAMPSGVTDANTADNTASDTDTVVVGAGSVTVPATVAFGAVTPTFANPLATRTITVSVSNAAAVTFAAAQVTTTQETQRFGIAADTCSGQTVAAGGTCSITISFNGLGTTARTGTLILVDDAANGPQSVALSGN
jgi:uncharacterized repeat protein (TIGR01451 family)